MRYVKIQHDKTPLPRREGVGGGLTTNSQLFSYHFYIHDVGKTEEVVGWVASLSGKEGTGAGSVCGFSTR